MTAEELNKLYLETEHGTFTPIYTYEDYKITKDEETGEIISGEFVGLVIIKTADEVYQEWLYNKENPPVPQPTLEHKITLCLQQITALEEENMVLCEYVLGLEMKSLEQEETTTMTNEYVLDIDMRLTNIETK